MLYYSLLSTTYRMNEWINKSMNEWMPQFHSLQTIGVYTVLRSALNPSGNVGMSNHCFHEKNQSESHGCCCWIWKCANQIWHGITRQMSFSFFNSPLTYWINNRACMWMSQHSAYWDASLHLGYIWMTPLCIYSYGGYCCCLLLIDLQCWRANLRIEGCIVTNSCWRQRIIA